MVRHTRPPAAHNVMMPSHDRARSDDQPHHAVTTAPPRPFPSCPERRRPEPGTGGRHAPHLHGCSFRHAQELASRLGLTLPTVSGVLADLDRAGLIERHPDPADRRRTIVAVAPDKATLIGDWLDGAAMPLARALDKLTPSEQQAFVKAMDLLETELRRQDAEPPQRRNG
jgi:DNA-binding MarR family transcriptional regulator